MAIQAAAVHLEVSLAMRAAIFRGPSRASQMKPVSSQIRGFYLVKFAVSVTACHLVQKSTALPLRESSNSSVRKHGTFYTSRGYLTIQLLITFAEVLLPFIFAMLIVIVLEPLKKFVLRVFSRLVVRSLAASSTSLRNHAG